MKLHSDTIISKHYIYHEKPSGFSSVLALLRVSGYMNESSAGAVSWIENESLVDYQWYLMSG